MSDIFSPRGQDTFRFFEIIKLLAHRGTLESPILLFEADCLSHLFLYTSHSICRQEDWLDVAADKS
jgi:hypothetical protein